jgi:hypothetical protein
MKEKEGRKQFVRQDKQILPTSLGLPPDLKTWLDGEAHRQGVSRSRLAANGLEFWRKHLRRQSQREARQDEEAVGR